MSLFSPGLSAGRFDRYPRRLLSGPVSSAIPGFFRDVRDMTVFKAAAVQMRSGIDVAENVAAAEQLVRAAVAAGAQYVLTPEMTTVLDRDRARLLAAIAPEEEDPSLARFREL